jgi:hypothetical protein
MRPSAWTAVVMLVLAVPAAAVAGPPTAAPRGGDGPVPCWEESPPCGGQEPTAEEPTDGAQDEADAEPIVISRASGRGRPEAAEMAAWRGELRRQLAPLAAPLARLLAVRKVARPPAVVPRCRELAAALATVDRERLFPAPDLAADLHLKHALALLGAATAACADGRFAATDYYLDAAGRALSELDLALRRYAGRR